MRISARCDYACRALLELSLHWPEEQPLAIHTISERQDIPMRYLVQILLQLKRGGYVASVRGKEGGYNLAMPPVQVKLGEVLREMGGPLLPVANSHEGNNGVFSGVWTEVEQAMAQVVDRVTFEDIAGKARGKIGTLIYQI